MHVPGLKTDLGVTQNNTLHALTLGPVSWTDVTRRWEPFTSYKRKNQVAGHFHMQHAVFLQLCKRSVAAEKQLLVSYPVATTANAFLALS